MEAHQSQYPTAFYRVSVKAIIRNEKGEILVVKEHDGADWSFPGGGWDHHETEHEALARELYEEVNYQGDFTSKPVATAVFWVELRKAWLLWIVYEVETENQNFSIGDECTALTFIDPKTLKDSPHRTERWIYDYFS